MKTEAMLIFAFYYYIFLEWIIESLALGEYSLVLAYIIMLVRIYQATIGKECSWINTNMSMGT